MVVSEPLDSSVSIAELRARITNKGGEDLNDLPAYTPDYGFYVNQTAGRHRDQ